MAKLSKRQKQIRELVEAEKLYPIDEALELLKSMPAVKFAETMEMAVNLGVDPRKSDQVVRGSTVLPNGTGNQVRVAVFTQGANADAATEAGADAVGMEELADQIKGGDLDWGVVIASPDAMRIVGALGPVLGPRGLMPNPKVGTVTPNVAEAVKNAKAGQVRFRTDKAGIIHCAIGKKEFDASALRENMQSVLNDLKKLKPSAAKGIYMRKITLSTTMGPGVSVDLGSLDL